METAVVVEGEVLLTELAEVYRLRQAESIAGEDYTWERDLCYQGGAFRPSFRFEQAADRMNDLTCERYEAENRLIVWYGGTLVNPDDKLVLMLLNSMAQKSIEVERRTILAWAEKKALAS